MNILYYICSLWLFILAVTYSPQDDEAVQLYSSNDEDEDEDDAMEDAEGGLVPQLQPISDLTDILENFDAYSRMEIMDDSDWEDLEAIRLIFEMNRRKRAAKYKHDRKDWYEHADMLEQTGEFENRFRMSRDHFNILLDAIKDAITVDFARSANSTEGNDPIYPEVVLACGLRFVGLGSTIPDLADLYGMSTSSARRVINMFLDSVDYNTACAELQVELPDPNDIDALKDLAGRWSSVSTVYGLLNHNLGCIDGWLPRTEMPGDVSNQNDYFSGHYQCFGLNVQALCDPDLLFLYVSVAAPGKVNDIRAFRRCDGLLDWLEALPPEFYIIGDNAYPLSRRVLIPFSGSEYYEEANRTYNYYLSQMRIRIEMTFGRLTTKWRILRKTLNFANAKNAKIVRVCTKLHNFCIRMDQLEGGGRIGQFLGDTVVPSQYGIDPLYGEGNQHSSFGYLDTQPDPDDDGTVHPPIFTSSLLPDASLRASFVADIASRGLRRPPHNRERNGD